MEHCFTQSGHQLTRKWREFWARISIYTQKSLGLSWKDQAWLVG